MATGRAGRGRAFMTVVIPTNLVTWVTRKARRESRESGNHVSRSRVVARILVQAQRAEEGAPLVPDPSPLQP